MKDLARKSALSYKAKDNSIAVLEDFTFEAAKTREYVNMLNALSLGDKKTLLILSDANKNVALSGRNVQNTRVMTADQINTYDLMNADSVIVVESAITKIENLLNKEA